MTKLIIQIPCYNEAETLGVTVAALPRLVPGVDKVEILVIDDGSTDGTDLVAREVGVHHVVRLPRNQGLAAAFMAGLRASIDAGADIIVNTDADNQYCADDIPKLVDPVLRGDAEIVVGARPIAEIGHFSPAKKFLQKLGSWAVRQASKTDIPDAPSGFRAFSRDAAMQMNVFSEYTYTLETIIQAGQKNMAIVSVPVRVNEELRPSRLIKSISSYISRSVLTIARIFVLYRAFRFFAMLGATLFGVGFLLALRFLYFYLTGEGDGHVQSVLLSVGLMTMGFIALIFGIIADLVSINRKLLERITVQVHRVDELLRNRDVG
ncbi:MAG: glycosyltransferase family 2 protein [Rhodospirillales bacterium]|nr:glycosyltransferase family 2 protein [Rhodospirillales bacterium]